MYIDVDEDLRTALSCLSELNEWETLGTHLRIKVSTMERIKMEDHANKIMARIRGMLTCWLQMKGTVQPKTPPTWRQLIKALLTMKEHTILQELFDELKKLPEHNHS